MNEQWLPVVGYEGLYEVSSFGNVRSVDRVVRSKNGYSMRRAGVLLKLTPDVSGYGYVRVSLSKDGKSEVTRVHRIVLEAFVGPAPSPRHHACHGDGDPANPRLSNLRWGTVSENAADRVLHGTQPRGERSHLAKLTHEAVKLIRASSKTQRELAKEFGVSQPAIQKLLAGKSWVAA